MKYILLIILVLPNLLFSQNDETVLSHVKIEPSFAFGLNLSGPNYYAEDDKTIYSKIELGYDLNKLQLRSVYQKDLLEDVSMAFLQGGYDVLKNDSDFSIVPYIGAGIYLSTYHQRRDKQWMLSYGCSFYYKKLKVSINKNDLMILLHCDKKCTIQYLNISAGFSIPLGK